MYEDATRKLLPWNSAYIPFSVSIALWHDCVLSSEMNCCMDRKFQLPHNKRLPHNLINLLSLYSLRYMYVSTWMR